MAQLKINREKVYGKYEGHCAYCGEEITIKQMQVDHIFPQSKKHWLKSEYMKKYENIAISDINDFNNLNPACQTCNYWKHNFSLEEFRVELQKQIGRVNRYSANYRMAKKYGLVIETGRPVFFYYERIGPKKNNVAQNCKGKVKYDESS